MRISPKFFIRLYPRRWRERYGDELRALIEESNLTSPRVAYDLVVAAVRERLRAIFIEPSPRFRQLALLWLLNLGSWAIGTLAAELIALALPDFGAGSTLRSICFVIGLFGTVGVFYFVSVVKDDAPEGLAPGVPPLTPFLAALVAALALAAAVLADLSLVHSYRLGLLSLNDLIVSGGARAMAFGPIGVGIAGIFWPEALRDLNPGPPNSSSTLGLGA